jgi:hypothetical protein
MIWQKELKVDTTVSGSLPLRIVVISQNDTFKRLRKQWNSLLQQSRQKSFFLRHEWLYTWWEVYGDTDARELFVLCFYQDEELVAIAPFQVEKKFPNYLFTGKVLRLLGQGEHWKETVVSEQQDVIVKTGFEFVILEQLKHFLCKNRRHWSLAKFDYLRQNSLLLGAICEIRQPLYFENKPAWNAHSLMLPASFNEYISTYKEDWYASYRNHLSSMLKMGNVEVRSISGEEDIEASLQSLSQVHCAHQWKEYGYCRYDSEKFMCFHDAICRELILDKEVKMISLFVDNRLLASIYYYIYDDVLYGYQMGSVRGEGIHFSPAFMLMMYTIESAIEQGVTRIEFMGDKLRPSSDWEKYGCNTSSLYSVSWFRSKGRAYFANLVEKTVVSGIQYFRYSRKGIIPATFQHQTRGCS